MTTNLRGVRVGGGPLTVATPAGWIWINRIKKITEKNEKSKLKFQLEWYVIHNYVAKDKEIGGLVLKDKVFLYNSTRDRDWKGKERIQWLQILGPLQILSHFTQNREMSWNIVYCTFTCWVKGPNIRSRWMCTKFYTNTILKQIYGKYGVYGSA